MTEHDKIINEIKKAFNLSDELAEELFSKATEKYDFDDDDEEKEININNNQIGDNDFDIDDDDDC